MRSFRNLFILILVGSILYLIFIFQSNDKGYIEEYNNKINGLNQKIDSLHTINDSLNFKIDTLNQQIGELDQQIHLKDNNINILRHEVNIKVNSIDSFNDNELKKFFTERYQYYFDSLRNTPSTPNY